MRVPFGALLDRIAVHAVEPDAGRMRAVRIGIRQRPEIAAVVPFLARDRAGVAADAGVEVDDEAEFLRGRRPAAWSWCHRCIVVKVTRDRHPWRMMQRHRPMVRAVPRPVALHHPPGMPVAPRDFFTTMHRWHHDQPAGHRRKKLGLVIDLDTCVGCQACATSCKEWNAGGYSAPLTDQDAHGSDPHGAWLNRVHSYEVGAGAGKAAPCISRARACIARRRPASPSARPAHPTSAPSDGIVLVNPDTCIGCKLCSWACPYGAREYDYDDGVMKKCTLCVDRIYNETFAPEDRIPACVRACPTGARHFGDLGDPDSAVSQLVEGARRLRSAAGDGLQAGQQVPAAAAAPRPATPRRLAGRRAARRPTPARWPTGSSPGPTRPCRAERDHASRLFGHRLHHGVGRRLRPADLARSLARIQSCAARSGARLFRPRRGAGADHRRAARPRPPISAGRSGPGARCRNGERRGCRARASPRSSLICRRALLGLGWVFGEFVPGQIAARRAAARCCARLVTLWCTGMIYASLPTIRAWHQPLVAPIYLLLALATGGVLLTLAAR